MASKLSIVEYGKPILRQKAEPITTFDSKLRTLAKDMIDAMHQDNGIGLAAQQIGLAKMICVIDISMIDPKETTFSLDGKALPINLIMPLVLINPSVKLAKGHSVWFDEGCLSFPGIRAEVSRPDSLTVRYQDVEGAEHSLECSGLLSRVIQHETDHLNGILFIDRAPKHTQKKLWSKLEALARKNS